MQNDYTNSISSEMNTASEIESRLSSVVEVVLASFKSVSVNDTPIAPDNNGNINISVPNKTSEMVNDGDGKSRFATEEFVQGQVPEVDFSQIEEQINDVRAVAEGKTKSFTTASLADLGAILGIDTSVVADEYEITTTEIVYKDKLYTLHQGDLFIIVNTQVPDYWVSIDDMKIYKMETSKVDLTGLATEAYVQDQIASAITTTLNTGV